MTTVEELPLQPRSVAALTRELLKRTHALFAANEAQRPELDEPRCGYAVSSGPACCFCAGELTLLSPLNPTSGRSAKRKVAVKARPNMSIALAKRRSIKRRPI